MSGRCVLLSLTLLILAAGCSEPSSQSDSATIDSATVDSATVDSATVDPAIDDPAADDGAVDDAGVGEAPTTTTDSSDAEPVLREIPEWDEVFEGQGASGTFALHELGSGAIDVHDPNRAVAPMTPASTFKILNSLIALESGAVADVDTVVPWDGVVRGIDAWNQDHSLRTGIEVSAVWAYQVLARRIGPEAMAAQVAAADYGNADIGGPIDEFWLRGRLRISAVEQIDVLRRLMTDELPFDAVHQAAVREILVRDAGPGWTWGHKTGAAVSADSTLGWLVGYAEHGGSTWVFAMNVDLGAPDSDAAIDPEVRQRISRTILTSAGALPPE